MTTPIYEMTEWAAAQASPWTAHNAALRLIEALIRGLVQDRDLTAPPGSCADGDAYLVDSVATGAWAGHDGELAVAVGANASNGWIFAPVATEGFILFVADEDTRIEYRTDDSPIGWVEFTSGGSSKTLGFFIIAAPLALETLFLHVFAEAMEFPDNFAGSRADVGNNPASTFDLDVQLNGVTVGTISISNTGVATFSTTGGALAVVPGDVLKIVAPGVTDTITDVAITLLGALV